MTLARSPSAGSSRTLGCQKGSPVARTRSRIVRLTSSSGRSISSRARLRAVSTTTPPDTPSGSKSRIIPRSAPHSSMTPSMAAVSIRSRSLSARTVFPNSSRRSSMVMVSSP